MDFYSKPVDDGVTHPLPLPTSATAKPCVNNISQTVASLFTSETHSFGTIIDRFGSFPGVCLLPKCTVSEVNNIVYSFGTIIDRFGSFPGVCLLPKRRVSEKKCAIM